MNNWILNEYTGIVETRDQKFKSKIVTDLSINYQLSARFNATIGGNNIFNVYPDRHTHSSNTSESNFIYSRRVGQFGVQGGNYFVRLSVRL